MTIPSQEVRDSYSSVRKADPYVVATL